MDREEVREKILAIVGDTFLTDQILALFEKTCLQCQSQPQLASQEEIEKIITNVVLEKNCGGLKEITTGGDWYFWIRDFAQALVGKIAKPEPEYCKCRHIDGSPNKTYIATKSKTCLRCGKPIKPVEKDNKAEYPCCDTSHKQGKKCPIHEPQERIEELAPENMTFWAEGQAPSTREYNFYHQIRATQEKLNELIRKVNGMVYK